MRRNFHGGKRGDWRFPRMPFSGTAPVTPTSNPKSLFIALQNAFFRQQSRTLGIQEIDYIRKKLRKDKSDFSLNALMNIHGYIHVRCTRYIWKFVLRIIKYDYSYAYLIFSEDMNIRISLYHTIYMCMLVRVYWCILHVMNFQQILNKSKKPSCQHLQLDQNRLSNPFSVFQDLGSKKTRKFLSLL